MVGCGHDLDNGSTTNFARISSAFALLLVAMSIRRGTTYQSYKGKLWRYVCGEYYRLHEWQRGLLERSGPPLCMRIHIPQSSSSRRGSFSSPARSAIACDKKWSAFESRRERSVTSPAPSGSWSAQCYYFCGRRRYHFKERDDPYHNIHHIHYNRHTDEQPRGRHSPTEQKIKFCEYFPIAFRTVHLWRRFARTRRRYPFSSKKTIITRCTYVSVPK